MPFMHIGLPLVVLSLGLAVACQAGRGGGDVRPPAVAGKFYPESAAVLKLAIDQFMKDAQPALVKEPLAIVVPHAGYVFSGQICADGYSQVRSRTYDVVVILGTNHTAPGLRKIALYPGDGFRTPLGTAPVDKEAVAALIAADPDCAADKGPHAREHSVEVQVPFIQVLFPQAKIIPVIVGEADAAAGRPLRRRPGQGPRGAARPRSSRAPTSPTTRRRGNAEVVDQKTLEAIASLDPASAPHSHADTGGPPHPEPLTPAPAARRRSWRRWPPRGPWGRSAGRSSVTPTPATSPIGERDRVVGYGAVVFAAGRETAAVQSLPPPQQPTGTSPPADKKALLALRPGDDLPIT